MLIKLPIEEFTGTDEQLKKYSIEDMGEDTSDNFDRYWSTMPENYDGYADLHLGDMILSIPSAPNRPSWVLIQENEWAQYKEAMELLDKLNQGGKN